jgi:hypothetical protein
MSRAPLPIVQELNRKTLSFLLQDSSTSGDNDTMKKQLEKSGKYVDSNRYNMIKIDKE